jgi:hypothetical protein
MGRIIFVFTCQHLNEMKWIASATLVFLMSVTAKGQVKVANYAFGKPGTGKYEQLSFWIKNGAREEVQYTYGKGRKEVKLQYLGKARLGGDTCFKLQFPNRFTVFVVPKRLRLKVRNSSGKYNKTFSWEYEGPVNGIGTFCDVCAEDAKEAMQLLRLHYLK